MHKICKNIKMKNIKKLNTIKNRIYIYIYIYIIIYIFSGYKNLYIL